MRTVIQRVAEASVTIDTRVKASVGRGLLVLVGIEETDGEEDIEWLVRKIAGLRIFDDENGVMNRSVLDIDGEILVISQFTLMASCRRGNRPSYIRAAGHGIAIPVYESFCRRLGEISGKPVKTGEFGADMKVMLVNDGPVTICIDTRNRE